MRRDTTAFTKIPVPIERTVDHGLRLAGYLLMTSVVVMSIWMSFANVA